MPVATKKLRSNRAWIERHINDPFVKRSRQEGYRARSVYKLIELNEKEKLIFHEPPASNRRERLPSPPHTFPDG